MNTSLVARSLYTHTNTNGWSSIFAASMSLLCENMLLDTYTYVRTFVCYGRSFLDYILRLGYLCDCILLSHKAAYHIRLLISVRLLRTNCRINNEFDTHRISTCRQFANSITSIKLRLWPRTTIRTTTSNPCVSGQNRKDMFREREQ